MKEILDANLTLSCTRYNNRNSTTKIPSKLSSAFFINAVPKWIHIYCIKGFYRNVSNIQYLLIDLKISYNPVYLNIVEVIND